jgi:hypothetical protein
MADSTAGRTPATAEPGTVPVDLLETRHFQREA